MTINWNILVAEGNAKELWDALFLLIRTHRSVRNSHRHLNNDEICADLVQEYFLDLLERNRLEFYATAGYENLRIENELRIGISNLINARRRQYSPESYRLSRRVSTLLKQKDFKQFKSHFRKFSQQIYGLLHWDERPHSENKTLGKCEELIADIPVQHRNNRKAGRGNLSSVIISNPDLKRLIIQIFTLADSPISVQDMRTLVLSKLLITDPKIVGWDEEFVTLSNFEFEEVTNEPACKRASPEQYLLEKELDCQIVKEVERFLFSDLKTAVNNNGTRWSRLMHTIWWLHCAGEKLSQMGVAEKMGVSDALVSDDKYIFMHSIQRLKLPREIRPMFYAVMTERLNSHVQLE